MKNFSSRCYGSSDDYHFASDFMSGRCQRHHSHGNGWQRRVPFLAFLRDNPPGRHRKVDLELEPVIAPLPVLQVTRAGSGILEFLTRELCSLTPSIRLVRFRTTALRMGHAAIW